MNFYGPAMYSGCNSYICQTLQGAIGSQVAVETPRGSVRGRLVGVFPDHVVVETNRTPFYIRTQQIIWIVPTCGP